MAASAAHLGSTNSSPASFDEDTNMMTGSAPNWQHVPSVLPPGAASTPGSNASPTPSKITSLPLQKRRRVTRACDECRRKKIKCDGKQPCTHCTVYSYECTYDQPSNRRRNPAPQYIEALENRLQRTEAFLKALLPEVDVNHPDFDPVKLIPQIQASVQAQALERLNMGNNLPPNTESQSGSQEKDPVLETMVKAAGRLDIDETGHLDFHGHSSGLTYLSHLNHQFDNILGEVKAPMAFPGAKGDVPTPSPSALIQSPSSEHLPDTSMLPSREVALVLVDTCLEYACVMMRFIHRPSFMEMLDRVYTISPDNYEEAENTFLPLLYLSLGVGCLFLHDNSETKLGNPKAEASKYFNAGRRMIEMTDIRDVTSLQAVLLMVIFLQSSARMSICYSYCCLALSAAVRMGMHRALPETRFTPVEREVRRRVFWTCWKMDTYVAALLGLPRGIQMEDVDQLMPADIDDDNITRDGIRPQTEGKLSSMSPANAHTRLLMIMAKLVKYIYPLKGIEASVTGSGGYAVSHTRLHEIEQDLARWLSELPPGLNFGNTHGAAAAGDLQRCHWKYLLRMSYSHVQMMLYRPFVHYLTRSNKRECDERSYKIAIKCVQVSRTIVHITNDMKTVLPNLSSYWFTIYTTFFSIITLVYYVLVSPPNETALAILRDAKLGKECIASITEDSMAAKRCTLALEPLFARIPEKVTELEAAVMLNKKNTSTASLLTTSDQDDRHFDSRSSSGTSSPTEFSPLVSCPSESSSSTSGMLPLRPTAAEQRLTKILTKKRSHMCDPTEPGSVSARPNQTPDPTIPTFQAHLSSAAGLPDLNAMMFPSPDPFPYAPLEHQYTKSEPISSPLFSPGGSSNPYGSLQGNIFGPLPPYLLQGQNAMSIDGGCGIGIQQASGGEQMGQWMGASASEAMIPDFFKDEWDDVLMQQTFRN